MGNQILRTAFLFILFGWISLSGQNVEHLIEDAAALNTFYSSLGGSNWDSKRGWPVEEEPKDTKSTPYGVSLIEIDTIQVNDTLIRIKYKTEKIDLHDNGLTGQVPAVTFDELIELNLYSNAITGFSSGFSGPELVMVNLQSNEINRWDDLSLPNLEVLNLNYNDLTYMIGSGLYPKLEYLY